MNLRKRSTRPRLKELPIHHSGPVASQVPYWNIPAALASLRADLSFLYLEKPCVHSGSTSLDLDLQHGPRQIFILFI